jgi:hypothetical protein
MDRVRVCFWTTTFQADVSALARYMDKDERFEPLIVLENKGGFLREPIQELLPVTGVLLDKGAPDTVRRARDFAPHVTVVDNQFPPKRLSPKLFVLWHGFGWKGPNDRKEFAKKHRHVRRLSGHSSMEPNPDFIWQCFGPTDLEHRHAVSGFARENLRSLGAASTDELVRGVISREQALLHYPTLAGAERVALIALTWHYGRALSHWGQDLELFVRLFDHLAARRCAPIVRLHDRKRYEPAYLRELEGLTARYPQAIVKFKDEARDSLLDLVVADFMISNFSSILNYYYATRKPSIHIYPVAAANEAFLWRRWKRGRVRIQTVPSADYVWKLPPEENGGLLVRSFDELLAATDRALADPLCCQEASDRFIDRHMAPVDGKTCERICQTILEWCGPGSGADR